MNILQGSSASITTDANIQNVFRTQLPLLLEIVMLICIKALTFKLLFPFTDGELLVCTMRPKNCPSTYS